MNNAIQIYNRDRSIGKEAANEEEGRKNKLKETREQERSRN
jgi:hypothetical protein